MKLIGNYYAKIDRGLIRFTNEDQALVLTNTRGDILMMVADGMGGHAQGDLAARLAIDQLARSFHSINGFLTRFGAQHWLSKTTRVANKTIYDEAQKNPDYRGMGTTLVAVLIRGNDLLGINVGDSRAYWVNQGKLTCLTDDQSLVNYLARTKQITNEEKFTHSRRHVLSNALGMNPSANMDVFHHKYKNQAVMLCSDGLYNHVNDEEIGQVLATTDHVEEKVNMLITNANKNGGNDNIAVALWESEL